MALKYTKAKANDIQSNLKKFTVVLPIIPLYSYLHIIAVIFIEAIRSTLEIYLYRRKRAVNYTDVPWCQFRIRYWQYAVYHRVCRGAVPKTVDFRVKISAGNNAQFLGS